MEVLVLGQSYEPIERVSWKRAMVWWAAGRVEILEARRDRTIRTPRTEFPMPSVVRFLRARRRERLYVRFSRETIYARDHGRCQYCDRPVARREGTYDHVVPKSRGGDTQWDNIVLACRPCNQKKGSMTPTEAGLVLHAHPTRPRVNTWQLLIGHRDPMPLEWRPYLGVD